VRVIDSSVFVKYLRKWDSRRKAEPEVAPKLLGSEGFSFDKVQVAASLDALNGWGSLPYDWVVLSKSRGR
jgi:hypothetical protein